MSWMVRRKPGGGQGAPSRGPAHVGPCARSIVVCSRNDEVTRVSGTVTGQEEMEGPDGQD